MGGDRQSTGEHMAPTNNKPCAQHTETSGGQPGHTSRTVTVTSVCFLRFDGELLKPDIYLMKVTTEVEMCVLDA